MFDPPPLPSENGGSTPPPPPHTHTHTHTHTHYVNIDAITLWFLSEQPFWLIFLPRKLILANLARQLAF